MTKRFILLAVVGIVAVVACWIGLDKSQSTRKGFTRDDKNSTTGSIALQSAGDRAIQSPRADGPREETRSHVANSTSVIARLRRSLSNEGARGKLSREVVETYLANRDRSALSLLVAWQESGTRDYLDEAAERFPKDPRVQIALLAMELPDDQRAAAIERLKLAAPDNPLANYYAAQEYFRQKNLGGALDELSKANGKAGYDDYILPMLREREELFVAAGLSPLEAKVHAMLGVTMPYLPVVNEMRAGLTAEIQSLTQKGDMETALQLGADGIAAARQVGQGAGSRVILNELVALTMERQVLAAMAPAQATGLLQQPVTERLAELKAQRDEITQLTRDADITDSEVSPEEFVRYFELMDSDGEMAALRWLNAQVQ
jgi:CheY-like chemotaxis protein